MQWRYVGNFACVTIYTTVYTTHTIDLSKMVWSILDQKYRKTLGIAVME